GQDAVQDERRGLVPPRGGPPPGPRRARLLRPPRARPLHRRGRAVPPRPGGGVARPRAHRRPAVGVGSGARKRRPGRRRSAQTPAGRLRPGPPVRRGPEAEGLHRHALVRRGGGVRRRLPRPLRRGVPRDRTARRVSDQGARPDLVGGCPTAPAIWPPDPPAPPSAHRSANPRPRQPGRIARLGAADLLVLRAGRGRIESPAPTDRLRKVSLVDGDGVAVAGGEADALDLAGDVAVAFPFDLEPGRPDRLAVQPHVHHLALHQVDVEPVVLESVLSVGHRGIVRAGTLTAMPTVSIAVEHPDPAPPVRWALGRLEEALAGRGLAVGADGEATVVLRGAGIADGGLTPDQRAILASPEALAIVPTQRDGRPATLVLGADTRGLVYAVLELADRVACAPDAAAAIEALRQPEPIVERPANRIRGVLRTLASDVEDLGWFRDRAFWERYLTELAADRFNRIELATGIGYDFAVRMRDSYLYLAYPFLIDVPGYQVHARGIDDAERDANLAALRFAAAETRRRGLHFQLGLWAQVYAFEDSPDVNHPIEGLTPASHATYCRDAVRALLRAVPEIDGLTLRVHGESGIPEGSYGFWETLFQ